MEVHSIPTTFLLFFGINVVAGINRTGFGNVYEHLNASLFHPDATLECWTKTLPLDVVIEKKSDGPSFTFLVARRFSCSDNETVIHLEDYLDEKRALLIRCSVNETMELVQQYRAKGARAPLFLVLNDAMELEAVNPFLIEGTRAAAYAITTQVLYRLQTILRTGETFWKPMPSLKCATNAALNLDIVMGTKKEIYQNFQGRQMTVVCIQDPPWINMTVSNNGTTIEPVNGIDVEIILAISKQLNFTIKFVFEKDSAWGNPINGTNDFNGMVGYVQRGEADMALTEMAITDERQVVIDYSAAYFYDSLTIVTKTPGEASKAFIIFAPYTWDVWLVTAVFVIVTGTAVCITSWDVISSTREYSWGDAIFTTWQNITGESLHATPWSFHARIIVGIWLVAGVIIGSTYGGALVATLSTTTLSGTINSLEELEQAVDKGQISFGTLASSAYYNFFQTADESEDGLVARMGKKLPPESAMTGNSTRGLEWVLKNNSYAFISNRATLTFNVADAFPNDTDEFQFSKNDFYSHGFGIAMTKGAGYRASIDSQVLYLRASGLINKWFNDFQVKAGKKVLSSTTIAAHRSFTLEDIQGIYYCWGFGICVSVIFFVWEISAGRKIEKVKQDQRAKVAQVVNLMGPFGKQIFLEELAQKQQQTAVNMHHEFDEDEVIMEEPDEEPEDQVSRKVSGTFSVGSRRASAETRNATAATED